MRILTFLFAIALLTLFVGCGSATKASKSTPTAAKGDIVGEWVETSHPERTRNFVLRPDGTYDEKLVFKSAPDDMLEMEGTYELTEDSLILTAITGRRTVAGALEERNPNPTPFGGKIEWKNEDEVVITVEGGNKMAWKRKPKAPAN
ncbi:MAG: hypothetical protein KF784_04075 [Fimbriimonadaceae bacterium]|nr:hypothetical protein [Fimbriimonadaceae bacterium]